MIQIFLSTFFLLIIFSLVGCSTINTAFSIDQGNIITPQTMQQLQYGESKQEVEALLGPPTTKHVLGDDCWYYTYSFKQDDNSPIINKRLVICFRNDQAVRIMDNYPTDLSLPF